MQDKEMFDGFNITLVKAKKGQSYSAAEELVGQSVKNPTKSAEDVEKRGKAYYDNIAKTAHALFEELVHCIEKGVDPEDDEVQKIIKKHHAFAEQNSFCNKGSLQGHGSIVCGTSRVPKTAGFLPLKPSGLYGRGDESFRGSRAILKLKNPPSKEGGFLFFNAFE